MHNRLQKYIKNLTFANFLEKNQRFLSNKLHFSKKCIIFAVSFIANGTTMRNSILSCLLLGLAATVHAASVTYIADNTTIFRNPERGFTEEMSAIVSSSQPNVVKVHMDSHWGDNYQMTLAVVLYNFNHFKSADLPEEVLAGFDEDMQILREHGVKCVLRFAYTEDEKDKVDAPPEWVKRHLEQLKPHLAQNADVIYVLEAGFVGVWGEWYYTTNYGNVSQHMNAKRRKVVDYLLDNAPEDRFILFRYPMIKTEYLDDETPLTEAEAFTGTVKARMGCHNDAFLNTYGNEGTYASDDKDDDPKVRQYVATETLYVPNGGETNVESNSRAKKVYNQAPSEMSTYHWSFCGSSYAEEVTSRWLSSGIFDTLNIHMGYRYNLLDAQFSDEAEPEETMDVTIRQRNAGYAPIYNERTVYLVLQGNDQTWSLPLKTDPRRWLPNGVVSTISEQVTIPADVRRGTYHLYLYMPDKYNSIAADPRYAVRFANKDVWDAATGMNDLGANIFIAGAESEAVDEVSNPTAQRATKIMEDGKLLILLPDRKKYSANGQMIK